MSNTSHGAPSTTAKKLEALKRELNFIGREVKRIEVSNSDGYESVDAIGQAVQSALAFIFEIELEAQSECEEVLF